MPATDFEFTSMDRTKTWKWIFDTIDANFEQVGEYLSLIGSRVNIEKFTATEGQTLFTLATQYNTARNCLAVYVNGARQWLNTGFTETSSSSFTLVTPANAGDQIVAVSNKYYTLNDITSDAFNNILTDIEAYLQVANANATRATNAATAADESAIEAESWAHGGTESRPGEDTDNAKYWYQQALALGTPVTSFKGRNGAVVPTAGDYTANQITFGEITVATALVANIAPMNEGNTAVRNYTRNRFMMREDGYLYRATATITTGDTLVVNGNIKKSNIDEVIASIEGGGSDLGFHIVDGKIYQKYLKEV